MKSSHFIFDHVSHDTSYISFLDWIKNKKPIINPTKKHDNKCFQYDATDTLNYKEFEEKSERTF